MSTTLQRGSVLGRRGGIQCGLNKAECGIDLITEEISGEEKMGDEDELNEGGEFESGGGESERCLEAEEEVESNVREELNKERARALPGPYWLLVQDDAPCAAESHFWHLCMRPAGQGDAVHVPLLKLKQVCCAGGVRAEEDDDEFDAEPDLDDLEIEEVVRGKGIRYKVVRLPSAIFHPEKFPCDISCCLFKKKCL